MNYIAIILRIFSALWSIRTTKHVLFYLYLWQIKEYQFKRFLDHFRTEKGIQLLFGKNILFKVLIFISALIFNFYNPNTAITLFFLILLSFAYFIESLVFLNSVFDNKFKRPVITIKSFFLIAVSLSIEVGYFFSVASDAKKVLTLLLWLLGFDLLVPLIISLVVMFFQPFFVLLRNAIVKKAQIKIKGLNNLKKIGITGSFGKTTTKEYLHQILSQKFDVVKTKEHQNSEMGIANTILKDLGNDNQVFVAEMAAYRKGGIKFLCNLVSPEIGIVVGANEQHLALFGSIDNLVSAEGGVELNNCLPENGTMILNWDNELIKKNIDKFRGRKTILCSISDNKADLKAENIKVEKEWIYFDAVFKNKEKASICANLAGKFNVINLLLAFAAAKEMGMNLNEISKAVKSITLDMGPIKIIKKQGITILDSSYSANPDGVLADLEYLKIYEGKKAIVMPSLIELGPASSEIHKKIGEKIGETCDLAIITTKDKFNEIRKGAGKAKMTNVILIKNPAKIKKLIVNNNYTVLLEGRVPLVI